MVAHLCAAVISYASQQAKLTDNVAQTSASWIWLNRAQRQLLRESVKPIAMILTMPKTSSARYDDSGLEAKLASVIEALKLIDEKIFPGWQPSMQLGLCQWVIALWTGITRGDRDMKQLRISNKNYEPMKPAAEGIREDWCSHLQRELESRNSKSVANMLVPVWYRGLVTEKELAVKLKPSEKDVKNKSTSASRPTQ